MRDKIFVSTGEVSGDLHISYIAEKIFQIEPTTKIYGVAGEHSRKIGVEIIQDIKELAIMGFVEGIKKYSYLKEKAREYIDFIKKEKINKVILVDYGGFNIRFLKMLKHEAPKVEVFYYIPPKVWIWGEKRVKELKLADHILVIFPWEVEFYKKHNIEAIYYGNPFVERYCNVLENGEKILLLPGSRKQEVERILPEMLEVVKELKSEKFMLKLQDISNLKWVKENINELDNLEIISNTSLEECVKKSKLAIATSGTVTLELSLLGIPTIVIYKTSWINAFIVKNFINLTYVSLPNLTVSKEVFPELLQEKCNGKEIIKNISKLENKKEKVIFDIAEVRKKLTGKDVVENYSKFILEGNKNGKI